jgi:hypothetical protein
MLDHFAYDTIISKTSCNKLLGILMKEIFEYENLFFLANSTMKREQKKSIFAFSLLSFNVNQNISFFFFLFNGSLML